MSNPYASKKSQKTTSTEPPAPNPNLQSGDETTEVVPDGTINEILEWAGDDKDRVQKALDRELEEKGRKTLIDSLEERLED